MSDDRRFSKILKDPRFKRMPRKAQRVKIDSRFKSMFSDSKFKTKYSVDRRGRPIQKTSKEDLKKYYDIDEDDEDFEILENQDDKDSPALKRSEEWKKKSKESGSDSSDDDDDGDIDFSDIRGGAVSSSSTSDEEDEINAIDDTEIEHDWGELDKDAVRKVDAVTTRLAVCNMDWDKITASDLFVLFSSFGGLIKSVKIYLSEFGKQRLAEEDLNGPIELKDGTKREEEDDDDNDDEVEAGNVEGSSFHMEKLRKYQLNRMKYYYAIVECDSKDNANDIYDNCDGIEYELGATRLDLRFVPDETEFDDEPKQVATEMPMLSNYQPTAATNSALQQSTVRLTWDETDPKRLEMTMRKFGKDELADMDFNAYLATSSEDEDEEEGEHVEGDACRKIRDEEDESVDDGNDVKDDEDDNVKKYRALLQEIELKDNKEGDDQHMEISWEPALSESTEQIVKNKIEKEQEKSMTPWEKYLKDKKKRSKGKLDKNAKNDSDEEADDANKDEVVDEEKDADDYIPTGAGDSFFVHSDEDIEKGKKKMTKGKRNKSKKGRIEDSNRNDAQEKNELELLLMDDKEDKQHFNMKEIIENERKKKRGRKRKEERSEKVDDFNIDVNDARFGALFNSPDFILDPSDPQFKKTKAMEKIIEEKQQRRIKALEGDKNGTKDSKNPVDSVSRMNPSLSALVNSVKSRTEQYKQKKKFKPRS